MTKDARGKLQMLVNYDYKVSAIIKRVSYTITTFLRPELMKLLTTENEIKEIVDKFLETYEFPQCKGKRWHAFKGAEPSKHYLDYIKRKGYFPLKVQAVCDYKYCFQHPVMKWSGSVHDTRI